MMQDDDDQVERLRATLLAPEPVPAGLVARLQAHVPRAVAERARIGWEARLVVACLAFAVARVIVGQAMTPALAAIMAVVAGGYAAAAVRYQGRA